MMGNSLQDELLKAGLVDQKKLDQARRQKQKKPQGKRKKAAKPAAPQPTPEQLEKIAGLSEAFSIGSAHVSTRQNIQLHWVQLEDVSEVMRGLVEVGLTTREACGNTVRNVMCSHFAGVCANEAFDAKIGRAHV